MSDITIRIDQIDQLISKVDHLIGLLAQQQGQPGPAPQPSGVPQFLGQAQPQQPPTYQQPAYQAPQFAGAAPQQSQPSGAMPQPQQQSGAMPPQTPPVSNVGQDVDLNQLSVAAARFAERPGGQQAIQNLLALFGVPSLTGLPKEAYSQFALKLRELGAVI